MQKKHLKIIINVLLIMSCTAYIGTLITGFLIEDTMSPYEMGIYMQTIGTIKLVCFLFILIKVSINKYLK
jgi:hypothetical protein